MTEFLDRKLEGKNGANISVYIGIPTKSDGEHGDWMCSYRIDGIGDGRTKIAMGMDGIQAINLAMKYVATSLYYSKEYEDGDLKWEGGMSEGDLGLPVSEEIREEVASRISARRGPA